MKILITGSKGQLGNELSVISNQYKHEFHFIDFEELDLAKTESIIPYLEKIKPDAIINGAAYTNVDQAEDDNSLAEKLNIDAPTALAKYCAKENARLFHISTDYVFDGKFYEPINEEQKTNPVSVYGKTKRKGEENIQSICKSSYIIRTSWLYSKYGNNFVKTMTRLGKERDELSVVIDQIGTPTHANDLAKAIMVIVDNLNGANDKPGIYHFSNEGVCSWYDFAIAIFKHNGIRCKVNPIRSSAYPTKAKRPLYSVLDKSKIKSQFKIEIKHWSDSLSDYFNQ